MLLFNYAMESVWKKKGKISIHLMLLFNGTGPMLIDLMLEFQYI